MHEFDMSSIKGSMTPIRTTARFVHRLSKPRVQSLLDRLVGSSDIQPFLGKRKKNFLYIPPPLLALSLLQQSHYTSALGGGTRNRTSTKLCNTSELRGFAESSAEAVL